MNSQTKNNGQRPDIDETEATYEVGYGKPPRATRFKPGQSGNPRGRPKKAKSINALLEEALSSPISITEGGKQSTVEQRTVLFKALVARAIKGDARATALIIRLMEQSGMHREPAQGVARIERVIVNPTSRPDEGN